MKKNLSILFLVCSIFASNSYACMRDSKTFNDSIELASTQKKFSTVGTLVGSSGDGGTRFASATMIDSTTLLTCAHGLDPNVTYYFSLASYVPVQSNPQSVFQKLPKKLSAKVHSVHIHPTFNWEDNNLMTFDSVTDAIDWNLAKAQEIQNVDSVLRPHHLTPNGETLIRREGSDLAILKLEKPLVPGDDFIPLAETIELPESGALEGYSIGYTPEKFLADGAPPLKVIVGGKDKRQAAKRIVLDSTFSFHEGQSLFYESFQSHAPFCNNFIVQPGMKKFAGLFVNCTSGGAFLAQDPVSQKLSIAGVNSRIYEVPSYDNLLRLRENFKREKSIMKEIDIALEQLRTQTFPIYNVTQPVAPHIEWIKSFMG